MEPQVRDMITSLGDGRLKRLCLNRKLSSHININVCRPHGHSGYGESLHHKVGASKHDFPILECAGFRLISITNDVSCPWTFITDGCPFDMSRETSSTTPLETRGLQFINDPNCTFGACHLKRLIVRCVLACKVHR